MDGGVEDVLLRKTDGWLSECRVACQAKDARVCSGQTRWRDRYSHDDEAHHWRHAHPQVHPCHRQLSTTFNLQINRVRSQNFSSQKSGKSRRRWGSWIAFGHKELWMTWLRVVLVCLLMVKCCCGLELNTFFTRRGCASPCGPTARYNQDAGANRSKFVFQWHWPWLGIIW